MIGKTVRISGNTETILNGQVVEVTPGETGVVVASMDEIEGIPLGASPNPRWRVRLDSGDVVEVPERFLEVVDS